MEQAIKSNESIIIKGYSFNHTERRAQEEPQKNKQVQIKNAKCNSNKS